MNYFLDAITKKYAQFSGRATRSEYWYFVLFSFLAGLISGILDSLLINVTGGLPIFTLIFMFGLIIPSLSVAVRRLHDVGRSGWWLLIGFIPILGLILLAFYVMDSKPDNEYGPNPKA